jgi:hypothetical protein
MKAKLTSIEGLETTSLRVDDVGEVISKVSGGGLKEGYLIMWDRDIREDCSFDVRNQCAVERSQIEFI